MKVVFSNSKNKMSALELVGQAKKHGVKQIELSVGYEELLNLEGLHGEKHLKALEASLQAADVSLYGLCLYTDFDMVQGIMLAKKCINILNRLEGKMLRIIINPLADDLVTDRAYKGIVVFLNSLSRFASYSAGGGGQGETTIRIAFDILPQARMGFEDILKVNDMLQASRNVGISLDAELAFTEDVYKKVTGQVNFHEFTLNHLAVSPDIGTKKMPLFLRELKEAYDGPIVIDLKDESGKDLEAIIDLCQKAAFNGAVVDYSKLAYPSSVARKFMNYGTASLSPSEDITAGTVGTWRYSYTVGQQGINEKGGIKFALHHSTDWEAFQLDNPGAEGYVSVECTGSVVMSKVIRNIDACHYICIEFVEGKLIEGDEIIFTIGDISGGAKGSRAQTFQQNIFSFFAMVDAHGYGYYFEHPNPPKIKILGGKVKKIQVIAPSVVYEGETFSVGIRVEDQYHNTATNYSSNLQIKLNGTALVGVEFKKTTMDDAVGVFENIQLNNAGIYLIEICDDDELTGTSNQIKCSANREDYKVYWGDIHGHLGYMDSVGTIPEYYDYGKNVSFLDFISHSEHMDSFSSGRQCTNNSQWELVKAGAIAYNEPGRFVTLLGYENSEIWDANIYFPGEIGKWHVDSFANRLFDFAKENDAIVIPHMTTYPQRMRGYDWSHYDEEVIPVVEIYSCHGSSEYFGGEKPLHNCEPGGYVIDALNRGCKLGFIGSADSHDCMPGNAELMGNGYGNGLVGIYAKELTREAVFQAIKERRCYATTNARILGYFHINDQISGSEMTVAPGAQLHVDVSLYGTADIESMDIIKNGEIIHSVRGCGNTLTLGYEDLPEQDRMNYYYVRMKQVDGNMIWLSPIFVHTKESHTF